MIRQVEPHSASPSRKQPQNDGSTWRLTFTQMHTRMGDNYRGAAFTDGNDAPGHEVVS